MRGCWLFLLLLFAVGPLRAAELPVSALPGWNQDHVADAIPPLLGACPHLPPLWRTACAEAAYVAPNDEAAARAFVLRNFRAVPLGEGLTTGYFELEVAGSRQRGGPYQVPVLRAPDNPFAFDRAAIEGGALAGRGLEMVWLTSAADLYFLQLQGSGRVRLPDGTVMRLGYAHNNGRTPIGTASLFGGVGIPGNDLSIPGLRGWIARHVQVGLAQLSRDPSYVFFRDTSGPSELVGHVGAGGAPLVPLRSIAVDPRFVPLGSPVWMDTVDSYSGRRLQRLMLADDTGDQIHGPGRADIYYGWSAAAEARGGHQYARGRSWLLQPVTEPRFAQGESGNGPS